MKLLKGILIIGLVKLVLIVLSTCSDKGYSYKWQDIIVENTSNGIVTDDNTLPQTEFGFKVNLINTKSAGIIDYLPSAITSAYASFDFGSKYYNLNTIDRINILLLTMNNNIELIQIVTDKFVPAEYSDSEIAEPPIEQLINQLNGIEKEPVESFDLFLGEPFEESITGRFVIEIELSDDRVLSDTTQTVNLTL